MPATNGNETTPDIRARIMLDSRELLRRIEGAVFEPISVTIASSRNSIILSCSLASAPKAVQMAVRDANLSPLEGSLYAVVTHESTPAKTLAKLAGYKMNGNITTALNRLAELEVVIHAHGGFRLPKLR